MTRRLKEPERAAVDMLLDRIQTPAVSVGAASETVTTIAAAVPEASIQAVEKVLDLLDQMPAPEPPVDLATRTLQRLNAAGSTVPAMPANFVRPDQPLA